MISARILGTGPGIPVLGKSHSAFWCRTGGHSLLFDCGEGTAQKLLEYQLDKDNLDAIVISHFHPDHVSGLFMVIQMLYLQNRTKPLTVFVPEWLDTISGVFDMFYLFPERLSFKLSFEDISGLDRVYPQVSPLENNHLSNYQEFVKERGKPNRLKSFSFLIRNVECCETDREDKKPRTILYTSDIQNIDHLVDLFDEADIVVIDALHLATDHLSTVLSRPGIKTILVHGISEESKKLIGGNRFEEVVIAKDGYQVC